jgi:hypothetical protein
MEITIITAIIGGASAIIGSVSTVAVKHWLERRQSIFKNLPPRRRDAISVHWDGKVYQAEGPEGPPIEFDIELHLNTDGTEVTGEGFFEWEGKSTTLLISGGYIDDYYLKLEYKDADYLILRYGTIFFQISPNARKIVGRFLGYAAEREGLIYGKIEMSKKGGKLELGGRVD